MRRCAQRVRLDRKHSQQHRLGDRPFQPINPDFPPIDPASLPISWYARGGVFNGPSVIGVGEAGTEAVVPLRGSDMRPFAAAIADQMGNGKGDTSINVSVKIDKFVNQADDDIDELADKVSQAISRKTARVKRSKGYGYGI